MSVHSHCLYCFGCVAKLADVTRLPTVIYSTSLRLRTIYKYSVNRDLSLTNPDL